MITVSWSGAVLPLELERRLRRSGVSFTNDRRKAVAHMLSSKTLPEAPQGIGPWIWVSPLPVDDALRTEAALRGAYDSISRDDHDRLMKRLGELAMVEPAPPRADGLVGTSPAAEKIRAQIARAARSSMPVLITGETGTGKEIAARLVHAWSARRLASFVPINCAAIPNELMEAELFGYAKGAFSGAVQRFDGQLMAAAGGTVYLDEIDDTPMSTQVKLLRVLEDHVVTRLGESAPHKVDFRLLASTNRDLKSLIASGAFGADFYERLAIVSIHLPPLRERTADIAALAAHFIERFFAQEPERPKKKIELSREVLAALSAYPWPGNIRELRNVIFEALVYKHAGDEILLADLPRRILKRGAERSEERTFDHSLLEQRIDRGSFSLKAEIEALEKAALSIALSRSSGNASRAAALLGEVGRGSAKDPGGTVRAMIRRYGLSSKNKPRRRRQS
jgi:DNA-binding NtrC family response regulator